MRTSAILGVRVGKTAQTPTDNVPEDTIVAFKAERRLTRQRSAHILERSVRIYPARAPHRGEYWSRND
jgi:hypothetical protein